MLRTRRIVQKSAAGGAEFPKTFLIFRCIFLPINLTQMFDPKDMALFEERGVSMDVVERQLAYFREGFPYLPVVGAAVPGDGIVRLSDQEVDRLARVYDDAVGKLSVVKFVPASGAASRMFREMYEFVQTGEEPVSVREALAGLEKFAFHDALAEALSAGADKRTVVENIVEGALGYGRSPKALIPFHRYPDGPRTALEEHLVEGALYARSGDGVVKIHFTISPEHEKAVRALVEGVLPKYEKEHGVAYDISYSHQKPKTDTIAVDEDNVPFRSEGKIVFRPGGHGALIENLNDIDADLIFIKTIDNVCPDRMKGETARYKKALAGYLLERQAEGADDRPIRVCGMVRNEGEPGGGPFRVQNDDGTLSLQIAESSQIAPEQKHLMREATHFNPVDLVCGVRNRRGEKYDLLQFVDPRTGFISTKSKDGRALKAQELPGLWNGAMAHWETIFVEVPIATFNPVKTVNDLLRPQHQG